MIVGTAGHVDHGKTALVRALTGVDTDRLPEEKARGISIELGYAYQQLPDGVVLGFVDVPGHERFVHTMVAGASGIAHALLVVAADDGVMPQTREHLAILGLLGIRSGTVALTKIDRVDPTRIDTVEREVRGLLAATPLAAAPLFRVCAPAGQGVAELRAALGAAARSADREGAARWSADTAAAPDAADACGSAGPAAALPFRLAIDRSFVLEGLGTVAAGTVHAGTLAVGDSVVVAPGGQGARVRSLHVHNRPASQARAGERCAVQLAGIARAAVPRGAWLVAPQVALETRRVDARVHLLAGAPRALRHWSPVQLHVGAGVANAHLALLEGDCLAPGQAARVQLVSDLPLACWYGDALVLRDPAARHTLGGGRVLDPFGWVRHRGSPQRLAQLAALERPSALERLRDLLEQAPAGIELERLQIAQQLRLSDALERRCALRRVTARHTDLAFAPATWQHLRERVLERLANFHVQLPEDAGPDLARLRRICAPQLDADAFRALVAELASEGRLEQDGAHLHLPGFRLELDAAEQLLAARLLPQLEAGGFDPPWVRELAARSGTDETQVRRTLQRLARRGELYQVVRDLFFTPAAIRRLSAICAELQGAGIGVAAARFRDATGLGRKRAIQILEFFDGIGYTRRVHDLHRVRADSMFALPPGAAG